jgi:hypothetical protein
MGRPFKRNKEKSNEPELKPEPTLEDLKDEHVKEKDLARAERESKKKKKERLIAEETAKHSEQLSGGLTLLGGALATMLCVRLPNPQPPTTVEKELLGEALSQVALDYVPVLAQYASIVTLAAMLAGIVIPRLQKPDDGSVKATFIEEKDNGLDKARTKSDADNGQNGERKDTIDQTLEATMEPELDL